MSELKKIDKPLDPQMTLELDNTELENLLQVYGQEQTAEALNKLVTYIHNARVIVPANINEQKNPVPCFIRNQAGLLLLPAYTSKAMIPEKPQSPAYINMPFIGLTQVAAQENLHCDGIVINPFKENLIFKQELIAKMNEVEKNRRAKAAQGENQPTGKMVKMTQEEYAIFERKQFTLLHLPKKLFEEGEALVAALSDKKEVIIDELFEASYQKNRLYPYLPEDFAVMGMAVNEDLDIFRIDLPERDMDKTSCVCVYIMWNKTTKAGRYFMVELADDKKMLGEMTSEWKHVNHGEAPEEGAQIQKLMEL